jgi:cell wall-associated NlpC family hydrolase
LSGANCQRFAYELWRHYGYEIANFRSQELWNDAAWTFVVKRLRPLDLLLFNRDPEARGAHIGVYLGDHRVIHLSKQMGKPVVWPLEEFARHDRYKIFLGAKRLRTKFRLRGTVTPMPPSRSRASHLAKK